MPLKSLIDLSLPEYRERHIFTTKLRLVLFVGFWIPYLYFFYQVLGQLQVVTAIVIVCFVLTMLSYFWVLRDRFIFLSVITEVVADLVTITTIVYITEGPYSDFFTIYLFYIFVAGIFYNYVLAFLIALACTLFYGSFLLLCQFQIIPPLIIDWGNQIPIESHSPQYHFAFWAIFSVLVIYGVKVASYFGQRRERMLEARNKELTALAHMGSTIRSIISLDQVSEQIVQGLQAGLELDLTLLVLFDREKEEIRCLSPKDHRIVKKVLGLVGDKLGEISFPLDAPENSALQAIKNHQIIYRKNLEEILIGLEPPLPKSLIGEIQKSIGFKKMVGVPLVAERELLGALIGFTQESHIDQQTVKSLDAFANQAALILETALLIQKLRQANEDLKEANRVKSEFLATMSHELRTPLTAIIGFSELLMEGVMGKMSEEQMDSLREVLNNGATLLDMINNLLDMAKVEAGKMELEIHPFDLSDLLQRLTQTIASLVHRKNHELVLDLPKNVPPIQADEKKVQQVLLNLLSNAIKFTPEGGKISIELKHYNGRKWWEKASWQKKIVDTQIFEKGAFELSVRDTGMGIKKENLSKVFEMFAQADSSVTRSHGGTGLGLTLAKQFVELQKGLIWVESEYGKGATFTVIVPAVVIA